jgi:hypothetical protein
MDVAPPEALLDDAPPLAFVGRAPVPLAPPVSVAAPPLPPALVAGGAVLASCPPEASSGVAPPVLADA